ncbi:ABC transporter permease [Oligoflexaceae bacterium]|nr:ABC transporter permease [Oligoflexaceae bacterium]
MNQFKPLFKREFMGYFRSPVAYVFIVIFLLSSVGCTFFLGNLYESNQASLAAFYNYLPWLYLVLVPAVGMRLWSEERRSGTIELLFTMPVSLLETVLAKFAAGWAFIGIALALTFPLALTVNYLGDPDNGVIVAGYLGSFLMAGSYLAISCLTSAFSKNQVISFILSVVLCFVMVLLGWGVFSSALANLFPASVVDFIAGLGFVTHFQSISRGLIDTRDILYFASVIAVALTLNMAVLEAKKAQ